MRQKDAGRHAEPLWQDDRNPIQRNAITQEGNRLQDRWLLRSYQRDRGKAQQEDKPSHRGEGAGDQRVTAERGEQGEVEEIYREGAGTQPLGRSDAKACEGQGRRTHRQNRK